MICVNSLRFVLCQRLLLLTLLISPAYTALMYPGNAIHPSTTRNDINNSPTLEAAIPGISLSCVSPAAEPNWAGSIDTTDCSAALSLLEKEVSPFKGKYFTFWSHNWGPQGPASVSWLLPYGKTSGSCVALFRIAKDFGDDVLPLAFPGPDKYLKTSTRPTTTQEQWDWLLRKFGELQYCVQEKGQPGWTTSPYAGGVLMLLSTESVMARQWSANAVGFGMNSTTLNLVATS